MDFRRASIDSVHGGRLSLDVGYFIFFDLIQQNPNGNSSDMDTVACDSTSGIQETNRNGIGRVVMSAKFWQETGY